MKSQVERSDSESQPEGFVHCLCMDLIGSTRAGMEIPTSRLDRFNRSLVEQIKPHVEKLHLTDVLMKFTGDGWLFMTAEPGKVGALCCLATIMANRFQVEMAESTGMATDSIPSLRLAICSGRDISVELPDGRKDWLGDSARRATRTSKCCLPNEILMDEPVRYLVWRDFAVERVDVGQRPPPYQPDKTEEALVLSVLGELKTEAAREPDAPECFFYTLGIIGRAEEATSAAKQAATRLTREAGKLRPAEKEGLQRNLRSWNRLMASLLDYSSALDMLKIIRGARLVPDVATYSTLIG